MVELIAEIASSHGGDRGLMEAFIAQCAEAGANWVKFQSYQVATLRPHDPQREWLAQAELSDEDHHFLIETCAKYHVKFLTTVFHHSRVLFLATLGLEAIKVGSGEAGEEALMDALRGKFGRLLVSTGLRHGALDMSGVASDVAFLRCVSRYPAAAWMCEQWSYEDHDGWSDHSCGIDVCLQAIWHGARIIEKHVQIDGQKRPGRPWEATMSELKQIRQFADADPELYRGRWQCA